jgi:hypothetical protein
MSIVWIDGFDLYSSTVNYTSKGYSSTAGTTSFVTGRFGGLALRVQSANGAVTFGLPGSYTGLAWGFAYRPSNLIASTLIAQFMTSGSIVCSLFLLATGALQFVRGSTTGTNVLCTTAVVASVSNWTYIEMEFTQSATVGAVNIYCNGALAASATAVNTGATAINQLGYAGTNSGFNAVTSDFDDSYVKNVATRNGECKVETLRPSSDAAVQWTPNSGATNFSRVNEAASDGDTSYVSSATVGQTDLYGVGALGSSPANIMAVQVTVIARKDDAASRQLATVNKSGTTTSTGATRALGSTYQTFSDIYETNPDTTSAWTPTTVNGLQVGQTVIA